ncbi:MAG: hypothetical protein M1608_09965 [Candidatus Omnitrophica bacterium]|nr:hypothetical protein [Candidatus Omnitrophota bacterium]
MSIVEMEPPKIWTPNHVGNIEHQFNLLFRRMVRASPADCNFNRRADAVREVALEPDEFAGL